MNDLPIKQNTNVKSSIFSFSQQDGFSQSPYKKKESSRILSSMDLSPHKPTTTSRARAPLSNVTNSKPITRHSTSLSSSLKAKNNSAMMTDDTTMNQNDTTKAPVKPRHSIKDFIKQQREKIKNSMDSPKKSEEVEIFIAPKTCEEHSLKQPGFRPFPVPSGLIKQIGGGFNDTPRIPFPHNQSQGFGMMNNRFGNPPQIPQILGQPKQHAFRVHNDDEEDDMELEKIESSDHSLRVFGQSNNPNVGNAHLVQHDYQSARTQQLQEQFAQLSQQQQSLVQQQEDMEKRRRRAEKLNELRMRFQNTTSSHPVGGSTASQTSSNALINNQQENVTPQTSPIAATPAIHQQFATRRQMKRMRVTFPTSKILSHFEEEDERRARKFNKSNHILSNHFSSTPVSVPEFDSSLGFGDFALPPQKKILDDTSSENNNNNNIFNFSSSSTSTASNDLLPNDCFKTPGPRNKLILRNKDIQEKNKKKAKFEYHTPKRNNLMKDANLALKGRHKVKGEEWLSKSKTSKKKATLEQLREAPVPPTPAPTRRTL